MLKNVRRIFLVGIFATAPLAITLYVLFLFVGWFDQTFQPLVVALLGRSVYGLGVLLGVSIIFIVGLFAPSIIGRQLLWVSEQVVQKLPLVKMIYAGTKQIFESFSQSSRGQFSKVVQVQFPKAGSWCIGLVTKELEVGLSEQTSDNRIAVFVPTTPNPTSGFLMYCRPDDVIHLDMSVEEALKLIISGGLASAHKAVKKVE